MLQVTNLNAGYADVHILRNLSLEINEKELICVVGPNGAGKTTLIKAIMGVLKINSGAIEFCGERIDGLLSYQIVHRGIACVPEGRQIFPHMTVLENLELGARTPDAKRRKKENIEEIFELFSILRERRMQLAGTLSGGEQQMVAIGRCLMTKPKLCLFDEPSLGLAPTLVTKTMETLRKINEGGVSILLVEQNVRQALLLANRAYVLENGRILKQGLSKELLGDEHIKRAYLGI